jgi:hypothetical protein
MVPMEEMQERARETERQKGIGQGKRDVSFCFSFSLSPLCYFCVCVFLRSKSNSFGCRERGEALRRRRQMDLQDELLAAREAVSLSARPRFPPVSFPLSKTAYRGAPIGRWAR